MFSPFQDIFQKAINQHGMKDIVAAAEVCTKFAQLKPKIFPEDSANTLTAKHFKSGALTIIVPDTVWANEVITRKDAIISEINAQCGKNVIERIRTELQMIQSSPEDTAKS